VSDPRVASGAIWDELVAEIARLKDLVYGPNVPGDDLHRAEGVRYLLRYLAAGIAVCVEHDDADHPEIGTLIENRRSWGLDNPDTKYGFCRLAPDATYLVRGDPGSACRIELQVDTGHFADGDFTGWRSLSRLATDDLVVGADGEVEIVIAPERPDGAANWMATGPDASYLHVREYFADWLDERPALLSIERVGSPLPASSLASDALAERIDLLRRWLDVGARCWASLGEGLASSEPGPIQPFLPPVGATGLGGQAYGMGAYRCRPDEAVILELEPPDCHYWSVSLATWFWESADIANRQCSLNHLQAVPDDDGVVRLVVAQRDPGVANWLDPAGYERGTVAVRYIDAETLPPLSYRVVPIDSLDRELVRSARIGPDERAEAIERRREGVVRRYRR
jgi:hypothetical protein